MTSYAGVSLWLDQVGELVPRPALTGDVDVDVAVVGAGYTGLWTAYYLALAEPSLRIAVVEREIAGFGASGRNGGWCSALFAASREAVARAAGGGAAVRRRVTCRRRWWRAWTRSAGSPRPSGSTAGTRRAAR